MQNIECFGTTNKGNVRENNEDFYIVDPDNQIFIIADGVGGGLAGEVASKNAVEIIHKELMKSKNEFSAQTLCNKILFANEQVLEMAKSNIDFEGMGTTLVVLWGDNGKFFIGNIGDSRVYLYRNDILEKLTNDHSVVQELINLGQISKEEARNHHLKHIVTQVIGSVKLKPDIYEPELKSEDILLLCTDGLSDMLTDKEIETIFKEKTSIKQAGEKLTQLALKNGGMDNITHILVKI